MLGIPSTGSYIYIIRLQTKHTHNMNTLSLILWDNRKQQVVRDQVLGISDAYDVLDEATNTYENAGIYLVNEIKHDTHTLVREFATKEDGLVISLILCGGRVQNVSPIQDMY